MKEKYWKLMKFFLNEAFEIDRYCFKTLEILENNWFEIKMESGGIVQQCFGSCLDWESEVEHVLLLRI